MNTGLFHGFSTVDDLVAYFSEEAVCIEHLERIRWNDDIVSPFDDTSKIYACKNKRYRCRNTGKYFNVKTATVFHNTKVELQKWFVAIWLMVHKENVTSGELAKNISVTQKTAWLMQKRISKYLGQNGKKSIPAAAKQMQLTDWLSQLR